MARHPDKGPSSASAPAAARFQSAMLDGRDAPAVRRFYLSLSPAERQMRFRGRASDAAVNAYCDHIDWNRTMVAAGSNGTTMRAAAHVHALSPSWERVVLTLACAGGADPAPRARLLADLVQMGVHAAAQRGCSRFAVRIDALSWSVMPLLAGTTPGEIGEHLAERILNRAPLQATATPLASARPLRPGLTLA